MNFKNNSLYVVILIVGIGILSFAGYKVFKLSKGGNHAQQSSDSGLAQSNSNSGRFGRRGQGENRGNFQPVQGTIQSISNQTIVIKTSDNQTKNIICSSSTRISEQVNGQMQQLSLLDLKEGDKVNVMAQDSNQSNIQARMIIVGDFTPGQFRGGQGGSSWDRDGGGYQQGDQQSAPSYGGGNAI